jgi:homoserine O-acetyltransferase
MREANCLRGDGMDSVAAVRALAVLLTVLVAACQPEGQETAVPAAQAESAGQSEAALAQSPAVVEGPLAPLPNVGGPFPAITDKTTIRLQTDAGDVTIEVYPQAAPNAVQRFVELVRSGFYDDTPISRVVPGFVAQFGINWREPHKLWENRLFNDDPSLFALERGTLAFAKAGPNSNATQVFINYTENNRLADPRYNFTTFGKVVSGMEVVDAFVQVGDPGGGLDQGQLWSDGAAYLASLPVKPTMIVRAVVVE